VFICGVSWGVSKFISFPVDLGIFFLWYDIMNELEIFRANYSDYVLGLDFSLGEFNFGDTDYDYSLSYEFGVYKLCVYDVVGDHYGMLMRNVLSMRVYYLLEL